jgi:hypothetical protein
MSAAEGAAALLGAEAPVPKRQLSVASSTITTTAQKTLISKEPVSATESLSSSTQCQYCLSEAEFFAFF